MKRFSSFFFLLISLSIATLWSCKSNTSGTAAATESENSTEVLAACPPMVSPLPQIKPQPEVQRVENPAKATVLRFKSGTSLIIPADCFVNEAGQKVTEPVDIQLTEYHDAADIIAAGIPMHTTGTDGKKEWLVTAGMFDLRGFCKGVPVKVARERAIDVDFASRVDGDFDNWIFDEKEGTWDLLGKGGEASTIESPQIANSSKNTGAKKPVKPIQTPESDRLMFTDLDLSQCPELKQKNSVILTYAGNDSNEDPKNNDWIFRSGIWFKKVLKPGAEKGTYQLSLVGEKLYSIPVKEALTGRNYAEKMAEYEAAVASFKVVQEQMREREKGMQKANLFRRQMSVEQFGFYNYDYISKLPDVVALAADFNFEGVGYNETKKEAKIYHVSTFNRSVIALNEVGWNSFRFSPSYENKFIAVLPDGKIAYCTKADFESVKGQLIQAAGKKFTFQMKVWDGELSEMTDFKSLLASID